MELPGLLPEAHGLTVLVALVGIVVLLGLEHLVPKIPAYLVWVALSIAGAAVFGLEAMGVASIGDVPSGLPALALPDLSLAPLLWPGALGIALMSFTESVAAARAFTHREDAPVNANKELRSPGVQRFLKAPPPWFQRPLDALPLGLGAKTRRRALRMNSRYAKRRPIDPEVAAHLRRQFIPEVEKLSELLDRDLTHWSRA